MKASQIALTVDQAAEADRISIFGSRWASTVLRWVSDLVVLNLAFMLAYWIRYPLGFPSQVPEFNYVPWQDFLPAELSLTAILSVILPSTGLYRRTRGTSSAAKFVAIFNATTVSVGLLIVLTYLSRLYAESRGLYIAAWGLIIILLGTKTAIYDRVRSWLYSRGVGVDNLIIVGSSDMGKMVMQHVAAQPSLGYRLLGFLDDVSHPGARFGRFAQLGRIEQLASVIRAYRVTEVIIALPPSAHRQLWDLVSQCRAQNVRYKVVPDLFEMSLSRVDVDDIAGIPLIGFRESAISGANQVLKRVLDMIAACAGVILSIPIWLIVAIAIKLDSRGPVLHKQIRVGKDGKAFTFFKFRSMREGAEEEWHRMRALNETDGPILKIRNDPRLTRVGRFLRRTSIDEIPQLLNVLRGEMSVVGPRPPLPAEVMKYESWHHKRLSVAGGITGLWQVSGRSHLNFDEMVMMDIYYIENWSLALDLKILLQTVPAILSGSGSF